jgi:adenylate cyclase class 2
MATETEVKFYLEDLAACRERILALGAESVGRVFESNLRFDDAAGSLRSRWRLLRLRQERRALLTFKQPLRGQNNGQHKVREEFEVEVSDGATTRRILEALGYTVVQRYEKWRETLRLGRLLFCLDEMPYGDFLEIEGPPELIRPASEQLRLEWSTRILSNYLAIFERLCRELQLPASDLIFSRFSGRRDWLRPLLAELQAGTNAGPALPPSRTG